MSTKPDQWMPLYWGDYRRDTTRLTTEGHGAYLLMLGDYWVNGPPPDDDEVLAAITMLPLARWRKLRPTMQAFFTIVDGQWHQKRADAERAKANGNIEQRSAAGKASAAKRQREGNGGGNETGNETGNENPTTVGTGPPTEPQRGGQQNAIPSPPPEEIISAPDGAGGKPPFVGTPVDFQKEVWARGPAFLKAFCVNEKQARTLIGRWIKFLNPDGDVKLLKLLAQAESSAHGDPIAYIEKSIQNRSQANGKPAKLSDDERIRQRRADIFDGVSSAFPGQPGAHSTGREGAPSGRDPGSPAPALAGPARRNHDGH